MKAITGKGYGSIAHLPGSRRGPVDVGISEGQARIATLKVRDRHDRVLVQEKLDGSNCSVHLSEDGTLLPLTRKGHHAATSPFEQHHLFAAWVAGQEERFRAVLQPGQRLVGEWLALAHGTRYALPHEPFVTFDLMTGAERINFDAFMARVGDRFVTPTVLHDGGALSIEAALERLADGGGHGALDPVEGAVWRVERRNPKSGRVAVDFLCKYVRHDKIDGRYLPEVSGADPVWNWRPS